MKESTVKEIDRIRGIENAERGRVSAVLCCEGEVRPFRG